MSCSICKFQKSLIISNNEMIGIDILRGILAILVLMFHSIDVLPEESYEKLKLILSPGAFWVFGFFVLSGFCISLSVYREISKEAYTPTRYLFARITRIFPLFYIGLMLAICVWFALDSQWESFPVGAFVSSLTGFQRFVELFPYFGVSWSITYEWVYYLIFPCLIWLCRKRLEYLWLVGIAVSLVATVVFGGMWKISDEAFWLIPFWSIPLHGFCWFAGVGLLTYRGKFISESYKWPVFCLTIFTFVFSYGLELYSISNAKSVLFSKLNIPFSSLFFSFLILSFFWISFEKISWFKTIAKWLGLLSYPLYLFHVPIQELMVRSWMSSERTFWQFLMVILVPLLVCGTIGVFFEKYLLSWRSKYLKKSV